MDKRVLEFLGKNRVSVLTTLLKDGTPHGATLHYSHKENPLELYPGLYRQDRKEQRISREDSGQE